MNKFGAKKVEYYGIVFDSQAEGKRYLQLREREERGEITDLKCHPSFVILMGFKHRFAGKVRGIKYIADFTYTDMEINHGQVVVEDVKGSATEVYKIKRKMFLKLYPFVVFLEINKKTNPELF